MYTDTGLWRVSVNPRAAMTTLEADQKLWPAIHSIFDFTLRFEDVVMGIVPSCLALLILPVLIRYNLRKPRCIRNSFLLWAKMIIVLAIVGADIANIALRQSLPESRTPESMAATILAVMASIAIGIAIYVVHLHNLQASSITGVYLSIAMLLDATKSRSFFIRADIGSNALFSHLGAVAALTAGLKIALLAVDEIPKTCLLLHRSPMIGPESTSGLWSRLLFLWLNPLLARGYRHKITLSDIGNLGPEFAAELLHGQFSQVWRTNKSTAAFSLAKVCFRCMPIAFLSIIVPELCATGFSFSQPFIMQRVIERLDDQATTLTPSSLSLSDQMGNSLIGATVLAFIGFTLTHNYSLHMSYRLLAQLRGALITELYAKCTRLSLREAQKASVMTLMTADIQAIALGLAMLYVIPFSLLQSGLGMYLLSRLVGKSFVMVLVPLLITITVGLTLGRMASAAYAKWNKAIDSRVADTSKVLAQLSSIKMHGLGPVMVEYLEEARIAEMEQSKRYRRLRAVISLCILFVDIATPAVVVAGALFWTGLDEHHVNAKQVFPALAIVNIIQDPLVNSIHAFVTVMTMLRGLLRIQEFFHSPENEDQRIVGDASLSSSSAGGEPSEKAQEWTQKDTDRDTGNEKKQERDALAAGNASGTDDVVPVVRFVDVTIAPSGHATPVLQHVNFEAAEGSFTAVVGAIGSGKSTFLHSILGEADIQQGSVSIDKAGPIGYCDQHVWLRNVSIRDNVIGPGKFDQVRYDRVMKACRLEEDVTQFSEGDAYVVGSNGSSLSGGQRQRLALARALYLEARIMVLDDSFSALDHPTAMAIFSVLFGENGMLKKSGCTVILSTHLREFLDTVPTYDSSFSNWLINGPAECLDMADQILVFDGKGNVTLENKMRNDANTRQKILDMLKEAAERGCKPGHGKDGEQPSVEEPQPESPPAEPPVPTFEGANAQVISKFGLYGMLVRSMGSWLFAVYLVMQMMFSALEILPSIYMRIWIEVDARNNLYFIGYAGLTIACCIIGSLAMLYFYTVNIPRSSISLHRSLSLTVMRSTLGFLSKTDTGSILNKYSQDMTMVARNLPLALSFTLYVFFGMCTQIGAILSTSKWIAIVLIVFLIAALPLQQYYLRTSRQMRHLELETHTPLYTQFLETSSGLRHIRAFGWEESFMMENFQLVDDSQKPFYIMYCLQRWLGFVLDSMSSTLCISLVSIAVHLPGSLTKAGLGLAFLTLITVGTSMNRLISTWTQMEVALGSLLRIHLFNVETPVERHESFVKLDPEWPREGKIEFDGVTARYNADDEEKVALRDVSFTIASGQKVGLKGRTGSGKTSVLLTLLGFLEYTGTVRIDGVDISTIAPDELRSRIVTISQHSVKLGGTVRDNLLPFQINEKDITKLHARDAELQAELVHVDLWETIQEKGGGLDAKFADIGLSAGQLQLFCIARAILRNRELGGGGVVLVDEGTSSIDYETDSKVQKALRESFHKCTVVTIAHRTNTIEDCDVQIELAKGELVKKE